MPSLTYRLQPANAPPWATITPSAPPSGTCSSAVTECDLFLMLITEFSVSRPMPAEEQLRVARDQRRAAGEVGVEALDPAVVERQHVVLARLLHEQRLQLLELLGHLGREVVRLAPVGVRVVELPGVVGERRQRLDHPRGRVARDRGPALVVDAAVAEHLEVLRLAPLGRAGVVERVAHAHALDRLLLDAVHRRRLGQPGRLEHGRRDVDHVVELAAHLAAAPRCPSASARSCRCACRPSARRPASSTGTACPSRAPSRRRSGCRPPGVPNSSMRSSHELGRLERGRAVEDDQLVEASRAASPSALAPLSPMM